MTANNLLALVILLTFLLNTVNGCFGGGLSDGCCSALACGSSPRCSSYFFYIKVIENLYIIQSFRCCASSAGGSYSAPLYAPSVAIAPLPSSSQVQANYALPPPVAQNYAAFSPSYTVSSSNYAGPPLAVSPYATGSENENYVSSKDSYVSNKNSYASNKGK